MAGHDWSKGLIRRDSTEPEERPRIEDLPWPQQWDRHREQHPGHEATLRDDGIYCNDCFWHTYDKKAEPKAEPAGWKPNRKDYDEVEHRVTAEHIRSVPLNYGSLAKLSPEELKMIEINAEQDLRLTFDRQGLTIDERTVRPHWQLVIEGYGFKMPEGYIHPEAPPEEVSKMREGWKRCVDGAADSLYKAIHLTVWRRRALPPARPQPKLIEPGNRENDDFEIRAISED